MDCSNLQKTTRLLCNFLNLNKLKPEKLGGVLLFSDICIVKLLICE